MSERPIVTLTGARGEEWERVLGTRTLPILSPSGEVLRLDQNIPERELCVMLDVDALSVNQREALIDHLARRFGTERSAAARDVYGMGVPIRLGPDTRIQVPDGYQARVRSRLQNGPNAFDLRFFT